MSGTEILSADSYQLIADEVVPRRHYWRAGVGAMTLIVACLLIYVASQGKIEYRTIPGYIVDPVVLAGLRGTLLISLASMLMGLSLGLVAALMRLSPSRVMTTLSALYLWFFRATPVLVQLLIWYNLALVFPTLWIPGMGTQPTNTIVTPFVAALLGLGLNEGAYMAEIIRGGLISVDKGQRDAANALGFTDAQALRRVILPQALRVIIPPTGNQFINMLKLSSVAYIINYHELLLSADNIYTRNFLVVELLLTISVWYLILTSFFTIIQRFIERRLSQGWRGQDRSENWRFSRRLGGNPLAR